MVLIQLLRPPGAGCGGACGDAVFDEARFSAQASLQRVYPTAELHYVYILRAKKHIILRNYIEFGIWNSPSNLKFRQTVSKSNSLVSVVISAQLASCIKLLQLRAVAIGGDPGELMAKGKGGKGQSSARTRQVRPATSGGAEI